MMTLLPGIRSGLRAHRTIWISILLIVAILVLVIAVLSSNKNPNKSDSQTATQSAPDSKASKETENLTQQGHANQGIEPSNDPLTEKALAPQFEPQDFCSNLENACFTYPPGWTLKTVASTSSEEEIHLTSPNGTTLVWQYDAPSQLPGSCDSAALNASIRHFGSMPHMNGDLYFIAAGPFEYADHIGILDKIPHVPYHPPLGDTGVCSKLYIPTFKSRRDPNILVSFRNLGHDPINEDDLPIATEIIKSFRYQ